MISAQSKTATDGLSRYEPMKKYLSIKQICERLPVSKTLVYRLVKEGTIPSTLLGGKILVPEDALDALLEDRQPSGGDGAQESAPREHAPKRRRRSPTPPKGMRFKFL